MAGLFLKMGFHQQQWVNIGCYLGQLLTGFKLFIEYSSRFNMIQSGRSQKANILSGWLELPTRQQHTNLSTIICLRSGNDLVVLNLLACMSSNVAKATITPYNHKFTGGKTKKKTCKTIPSLGWFMTLFYPD